MKYKVGQAYGWARVSMVQHVLGFVAFGVSEAYIVAQEVSAKPQETEQEKVGEEVRWKLPSFASYQHLVRSEPRNLQIHLLTIRDLQKARFEVVSGEDPDGEGEVEATLRSPRMLAESVGAIAAINTAAWSMFPDPETGKNPGYVQGGRADVHGWVLSGEKQISAPQAGYWSVVLERSGRARIEEFGTPKVVRERGVDPRWVISGFRGILKEGKVLVDASEVRHPRTAIGLNADGTTMTWMVVDGRQKGYSEGVSEEELAKLLLEQGCTEGINLDGGGSTSMWMKDDRDRLRLINRPSDPTGARPVPVILTLVP